MAPSWIFGFFLLASQTFNVYCQDIDPPPTVDGSYRAQGELVEGIPTMPGYVIQVAFEENFDVKNNRSAFTIWQSGMNVTYIENYRTNQTLQYIDGKNCTLMTLQQFLEVDAPPSLWGYENDGTIRFSVQRLLSVNKKFLKKSSSKEKYRGVPANMWEYEIKGKENGSDVTVTLYSYWSDPNWSSTSSQNTVPLGFEITKIVHAKEAVITTQEVNVFGFVHDVIDKAIFEPKEGIYCGPHIESEFQFPRFPKVNAMSIHSEIALADYQEVKSVDAWYDMANKLLRVDMDLIAKQQPVFLKQGRRISSKFTSLELGATFEVDIFKDKMSCEVTALDQYEYEVQDFINPKLVANMWNIDQFFGVNTTGYRYIGQTTKRNIPCHIFQGRRTDWPDKFWNIVSLWEWCLAVNLTNTDDIVDFRDGELPIVSLSIHFLESNDNAFPKGFRLVHHFYDVLAEDPDVMYGTAFDVSRCYSETQKRKLQFTIDVTMNDDNFNILENATSDANFLQLWRKQILQGAKLTISSLRIAKVRSTVYNKIMYVMFTLMDVHPNLPDKTKYQSLKQAETALRKAVDGNKVTVKYVYQKGKSLDLKAKPKTLVLQVDPTTIKHITTTVKPSTTTSGSSKGVTSVTPVNETSSESLNGTSDKPVSSTEPNIYISVKTPSGYSAGAVAGVTIAMVVVGISIGAGGTFYKYRGLPQSLRRA